MSQQAHKQSLACLDCLNMFIYTIHMYAIILFWCSYTYACMSVRNHANRLIQKKSSTLVIVIQPSNSHAFAYEFWPWVKPNYLPVIPNYLPVNKFN